MSTEGGNSLLPGASDLVSRVVGEVVSLVRGAAFWLAALLPFSYVPLLQSASVTFAGFTKLLLLNVVAVIVGHSYRNDSRNEDEPAD